MSTSKIMRAIQNLLKQMRRMARSLTKGFISWLLRGLLVVGGRPFASIAGFVLPTTVLLLLVVVLTVGAIGYRTYTRSQQAIGERQQRVIYNAATPAIDRAKAKLEFMFNQNRDPRYGGVPSEDQLLGMMLNDNSNGIPRYPATGPDPYTFPGETRINIGGSGTAAAKKDNAWRYRADLNGDGTEDGTVVYSIIFDAPESTQAGVQLRDSTDTALTSRANQLLIRNSPLSNAASSNAGCVRGLAASGNAPLISERGWFEDPVDSTKLRKNFQVDAYVVPDNGNTIATLEFQQDREAIQGFKWAAWFRNDLEIFPGPRFNWNGAMHSEGSYFISSDTFRAYMVSAPNSCIYKEDASTLTTPNVTYPANTIPPAYQGQFVAGSLRDNRFVTSGPRFDLWRGDGQIPQQNVEMDVDNDSITSRANQGPLDVSLDPYVLHTKDRSQGRIVLNPNDRRDTPNWDNGSSGLKNRMRNEPLPTPYLDDTFRADDRYGPKPKFGYSRTDIPGRIGQPINRGNTELVGNEPQAGQESTSVGLDGYWERRAQSEGARFIVGQRLELGNPAGWGGPLGKETSVSGNETNDMRSRLQNEPLRPWAETCIGNDCNQMRQRKSSWDNLAAVQATAIYHSASPDGKQFPAACLVTTIHPGTATTLDKSATFENLAFGFEPAFGGDYNAPGRVITDFFRGRGTDGWEYSIPAEAEFRNTSSSLITGLKNLAYFAGDPNGGAPSFEPIQNQYVHPYPSMSMWGDFSMLRRVLALMDTGTSYDDLSPADKTTLHTSACMLGMLAYNVDYLDKFNIANVPSAVIGTAGGAPAATSYWDGLRGHIRAIDALIYDIDRNSGNNLNQLNNSDLGDAPYTVPTALRSTIPGEIANLLPDDMNVMAWIESSLSTFNNDPETYVRFLEFWRDSLADSNALKPQLTKEIYLAQMIISQQQVARDRRWGFQGSYGGIGTTDALSQQCSAWYGPANSNNYYHDAVFAEPLMRLCSNRPRYPILYSLFPLSAHGDVTDVGTKARDNEDNQSPNYQYLRLVNRTINYNVVSPADIRTVPLRLDGTQIGYDPSLGGRTWRTPVQAHNPTTGSTPNSNRFNLIKVCDPTASGNWQSAACSRQTSLTDRTPVSGNLYRVAFRDSAFMNGREQLSVRTLDLDLDMMRQASIFGDYWLPRTGVIYAFREDAVSEAQIVRKAAASLSNCDTETDLRTSSQCQMTTGQRISAADSTDPPLSDLGISPKPVDYFPDPDRRPNGFRLRNGAALWRGSVSGGQINDDANPKGRGLSFITHNPAYVQGYFNLHRDASQNSLAQADSIEEFQQKLNTADFDNNSGNLYAFYNRTDLNLNFADMRYDQWRPAELIADAVTPLSTNFCDGSLEDGLLTVTGDGAVPGGSSFVTNRYGCQGTASGITSYLNQNRRNAGLGNNSMQRGGLVDSYWRARLNGSSARIFTGDKESGNTPVFVYRSGRPVRINSAGNLTEYDGGYSTTDSAKPLIAAPSGIQMNLIMVSAVVPSREGQSYGGLHNFPRFLENWGSQEFFISGAFLQLNFSTYATAPFDQEQWEPTLNAPNTGSGNNEWISYYSPPLRRWGFDVGLKYAAPGPVAARFRTADPNRSEFYNEPAANDPYIQNLIRCAAPGSCPGT